jgi:hypothetical protein
MADIQLLQMAADTENRSKISRVLLALLIASAGLMVCGCVVRQVVSWRNFGDLEVEGGIWAGLALDARDGIIYRDIVSPLGYGGTRYGPLHFMIHAALLKAGMTPISSGFVIGIVCTFFVLAGIYTLMRKLQTPRPIAIPLTLFFLAPFCVRSGILSIKADLLAAGLDVWGLVAAMPMGQGQSEKRNWQCALIGGACFALATASKVTSLFGIATMVTWLWLRRDLKNAARLLGVFLIGATLIAVIVQLTSEGRAIHVFLTSASAGGGIRRLLQAPEHFFPAVASRDRAVGGFWILAVIALLAHRQWRSFAMILMLFSTLGTLAIFGSPGTDMNHLMDLQIASLVALAVECRPGWLGGGILVTTSLITLHAAHSSVTNDLRLIRGDRMRQRLMACIADTRKSAVDGPIFAQNPTIPILAGERPYILDCMIYGVIAKTHPDVANKLREDLLHQRFRAFIVTPDPTPTTIPAPTDPWPQVLDAMKTRYQLAAMEGRAEVYLPKSP